MNRLSRARTLRPLGGVALAVAAAIAVAVALIMPEGALIARSGAASGPGTPEPAEESFWPPDDRPRARLARERVPVELGMRFAVSRPGTVVAIRFYKHRRGSGRHTASLWDRWGNRLARARFTAETPSGWQEVRLPHPVPLRAGQRYTVSYHAGDGVFALVRGYFRRHAPRTGSLRVRGRNGVYAYGRSAFPRRHSRGHNYLVDVVFRPGPTATTTPTRRPSPTITGTPTDTPTPGAPPATSTSEPTGTVTPSLTNTPAPTVTSTPGDPSPTSTSSPTGTVTPSPTGEPTSPAPSPTVSDPRPTDTEVPERPGCDLPRYPTPECTGVPGGLRLTSVKGNLEITRNGEVVEGVHVTGDVIVAADKVVIRNSRIDGLVTNWKTGGSFTITDSTVGPPEGCRIHPAVGEKNFTAERIRVRGFDDGFRMSGRNVTIRDSYVKLCGPPTSHSDGIQAYCPGSIDCSGLVFDHNTVDQRQAPEHSDPVNLVDKNLSRVTVTDNLLAGGNYTLFLHWRSGPKWRIAGNKLVHDAWDFGPVSSAGTCANIDWGPGNAIVAVDRNYRVTETVRRLTACIE